MSDLRHTISPAEINDLQELSDPEAVKELDALIDEYNADLERIKREKDYEVVLHFYKRAHLLIVGKEFADEAFCNN